MFSSALLNMLIDLEVLQTSTKISKSWGNDQEQNSEDTHSRWPVLDSALHQVGIGFYIRMLLHHSVHIQKKKKKKSALHVIRLYSSLTGCVRQKSTYAVGNFCKGLYFHASLPAMHHYLLVPVCMTSNPAFMMPQFSEICLMESTALAHQTLVRLVISSMPQNDSVFTISLARSV